MSYGYSAKTIELNKKASSTRLGVALGRAAIKKGVPVVDIAFMLNVSRQTVYNWFIGAYDPKPELTKSITKLIANRLSK
jgi:hypothetical protein